MGSRLSGKTSMRLLGSHEKRRYGKEFGLREPLQLSMEEICRDIQLSFPSL